MGSTSYSLFTACLYSTGYWVCTRLPSHFTCNYWALENGGRRTQKYTEVVACNVTTRILKKASRERKVRQDLQSLLHFKTRGDRQSCPCWYNEGLLRVWSSWWLLMSGPASTSAVGLYHTMDWSLPSSVAATDIVILVIMLEMPDRNLCCLSDSENSRILTISRFLISSLSFVC